MRDHQVHDYSAILLDHYEQPRNLGDLPEADAVALVHNPVCGDILRLAVQVTAGRIVEARFKAYGCAAAIAAGSMLTEMLTGASLEEAGAIREADLIEALGGLPPMRVHAAVLGREGIRELLVRLRDRSGAGKA
ncbi:MAG: iron-sulfur cluster assembly scaffold protein [Acidobacteriota bacterium]